MTKTEKEQIQYLLNQYLEGGSSKKDMLLLFELMDRDEQDAEWADILEELITSEPEFSSYEPGNWEEMIQNIVGAKPGFKSNDQPAPQTTAEQQQNILRMAGNAAGKNSVRVIALPQIKNLWQWVTAAAAVLVITVAAWFMTGDGNSTIATQYSQQKKISLPDQSEIILNAHSNITYNKNWKKGQPREVWLKGEAFFKVLHVNEDTNSIKPEERFIVYTKQVKIEVLGTVFNVRERRGKIEIVLQQGSIKVSFTNSSQPDIVMKPGEIVSINDEQPTAILKTIVPGNYTAWTKNKLILTDASLKEIVDYMEDNFGRHIILSDTSLANRKVEGTFKIDNLDDALFVLSKALNIDIRQTQDTLFFKPK